MMNDTMESNKNETFGPDLNQTEDSVKDNELYLLELISSLILPKQLTGFDEQLDENLYRDHLIKLESKLVEVTDRISNKNGKEISKDIIVQIIILVGEHTVNELWSNSKNVIECKKLLCKVLEISGYKTLDKLLLGLKSTTFFSELRPKLLKNTWKNYPAAISCFSWILQNIKCPHLGDVFHIVLPTCLLMVDDYELKNKIIGLKCLQHVADNVSRTDLIQFERGVVIYKAVEHMIYQREPEIIIPLGSFLVSLLSKTEQISTQVRLSWNLFDNVFNIWLPSMEFEQRLVLREAYAKSLVSLIPAAGLSCARWSDRILRIADEYCAHQHSRDIALKVIHSFVEATWPTVHTHFGTIIVIIMKMIIGNTEGNTFLKTFPESTEKLIKKCLISLEKTSSESYNTFRNEINKCSEMNEYFSFLNVDECSQSM